MRCTYRKKALYIQKWISFLFQAISYEAQALGDYSRKDSEHISKILRRKPIQLHQQTETAATKTRELLHYMFEAALPFVATFFRQVPAIFNSNKW